MNRTMKKQEITFKKLSALTERVESMKEKVNAWLDEPSEYFSVICSSKQTRRSGIRLHLFTGAAVLGLLLLNESPLLVLSSMVCSGYCTYRLTDGQMIKHWKEQFKNIEE